MGRLREETLERVKRFSDRVLQVVDVPEADGRSRRVLDQLTSSGASVGANVYEADEAMSRPDFCKTLGIVIKELNEPRFWPELCVLRGWISDACLGPLRLEARELKKVFGAMISRTRRAGLSKLVS